MNWLPNVQKRAFHYVLNRLALFSDLELENMDISLGTAQKAALNNVKLDPDRLNLPAGMYMRSGTIDEVSVEMRLLGGAGIAVKVDGVHITASVKQMDVETATEHVEEFLERTTADLAASILMEEDSAEEPPLLGMGGLGVSEALVKKVTQTVLSQLTVDVTNVHVTLFVGGDDKMDVVVDEVRLRPKGGQEMALQVRGVKVSVVEKPSEPQTTAHATSGFTSESESDSDSFSDAKKSLLQSTIFSHEEASSIYMSAIAESGSLGFASDPLVGVFYVDTIDVLVFLGEEMRVSCDMGEVRVSLDLFPKVVLSLVKLGSGGRKSREGETEGTKVDLNLSVKSVSASVSKLDTEWGFAKEELVFSVSGITTSSGEFHKLQIGVCEVTRGEKRVFGFDGDTEGDSDADILLKASAESFTLVLPKKAKADFAVSDLVDVVTLVMNLVSLVESKQPKTTSKQPSALNITIQTNTFDITLAGHKLYIMPIRFSNGKVSVSRISFVDIHIKGIAFEQSTVSVDKVEFNISLPLIEQLSTLFEPVIGAVNASKNTSLPPPVHAPPPKLLRIVEEPVETKGLEIVVSKVSGNVDLGGKIGVVEVILGGVKATGPLDKVAVETVEVGRDLGDLGLDKKWLVHPLKRVSIGVSEYMKPKAESTKECENNWVVGWRIFFFFSGVP